MPDTYKVDYKFLEEYCKDIFAKKGVPESDAWTVAKSLVDADLRNVNSHGVIRVGNYLDRLEKGGSNPLPDIKIISETAVTAVIDGDDGFGSVVSAKAADLAREKAKKQGLSYVAARKSNHYGAAAYWSLRIAGDDMIGITGSNVEPFLCVPGGRSKAIGNNPFSYAFPSGKYGAVCFDIACSKMAGGKMLEHRMSGKPLPEGNFCDSEGNPTTDPFSAAMMVPFGKHKGYGLAVVVELLSSVLAGGNFGYDMGSQYEKLDSSNHISHYFMAIKIDALRPLEAYKASVDKFVEYLHGLPTVEGTEKILAPGEPENRSKARKMKEGIVLPEKLVDELIKFGTDSGLSDERSAFFKALPV